MAANNFEPETSLSPLEIERIDRTCDQFEELLKRDQDVRIDEFLVGFTGTARDVLIRCLALLELDYRRRRGKPHDVKTLVREYPMLERELANTFADPTHDETIDEGSRRDTTAKPDPITNKTLAASHRSQSPRQSKRGKRIGDYEPIRKIGEGGMGKVYLARHCRLDTLVAIKLLPSRFRNNAQAVARFQREWEAVGKLEHGNIVRALDAGVFDGIPYLVMEYVEGDDLKSYLKPRRRLPVKEALEYISMAAEGLDFAHQRGVIHRDIKPSNLLRDKHGKIKILDLGLAHVKQDSTGVEELTRTGHLLGTFQYMAPEQAVSPKKVTASADIYSLGCTLYALIAGGPPYKGENEIETLLAHQNAMVPTLGRESEAVTSQLEATFQKMVAKEPTSRHQSASELLAELKACLEELSPDENSVEGKLVEVSLTDQQDQRKERLIRRPNVSPKNKLTLFHKCVIIGSMLLAMAMLVLGGIAGYGLISRGTITIEPHRTRGLYVDVLRNGKRVASATRNNRFSVRVPPGEYRLVIRGRRAGGFRLVPSEVSVALGQVTRSEMTVWDGKLGEILLSTYEVSESIPSGEVVATMTVRGADPQNPPRFTLLQGSEPCFEIDGPTLRIRQQTNLDFESYPKLALSIKASDRHGRESERSLHVSVKDVNEAPTAVHFCRLPRNTRTDSNCLVGYLLATDEDADDSHTFELVDGGRFRIRGNELHCADNESEMAGSHTLVLRVSDAAGNQFVGETQVVLGSQTHEVSQVLNLQHQTKLSGHVGYVGYISFSNDGKTLYSPGEDKEVRIWDVTSGKQIGTLSGHTGGVISTALSPNGEILASSGHDNSIILWNPEDGSRAHTLQGHEESVWRTAFSEDGKVLASVGDDETVRTWDVGSGTQLEIARHPGHRVRAVADLRDGQFLSGGLDLRIWDWKSVSLMKTIPTRVPVSCVSLSPNGNVIALLAENHTIMLLDMTSERQPRILEGHSDAIQTVQFSRDGSLLASTSTDQTIRLWDVSTGDQLWVQGSSRPLALAFTPNGKTLASTSWSGHIRLWKLHRKQRQSSGNGLDLIALINAHEHTVDGTTIVDGAGLLLEKAIVRVPVTPRKDYRIRATIANVQDDDDGFFGIHLPVGKSQVWFVAGHEGIVGLYNVNERTSKGLQFTIQPQVKHEIDMSVRVVDAQVIIKASIDGKYDFHTTLPVSSLAPINPYIPDAELGFWSDATACRIHEAELTLLSHSEESS